MPIAKKNTKGKTLYGVLSLVVNIGTNTNNNITPLIKIRTALAFGIPFLDVRNKPTTNGNKNITIIPSYLKWDTMLANPPTILGTSNDEISNEMKLPIGVICMKTRPRTMTAKYDDSSRIFFLLGKFNIAMKRMVIGRNPIDRVFDRTAGIKETEDKDQLLKIKYIESR